jgi:hypothetical protein
VRLRIALLVGALILAVSMVGIGTALAASNKSSSHTTSKPTHMTAKAATPTKKKAKFTG